MRKILGLVRYIFLSRISIIYLTPVFSIGLVYFFMNMAMQYVRHCAYEIPWFGTWFYTPKQIYLQMLYFQSINNNYLPAETLKAATINKMILLTTLMISVSLGAYIFVSRYKSIKSSQSDRHGNSRWASIEEIKESGLLAGDGVVIGAIKIMGKTHYLQDNSPEPVLGVGPTRSGKGTGWVIPSLLKWKSSIVAYDPKGENWNLTANARRGELGNKCLRFAPNELPGQTEYENVRINCLDTVRYGTLHEVSDADRIATIISDTGELKKDYWEEEAKNFLKAAILHVVYVKPSANLTDVAFFVSGNPEDILYEMVTTDHAHCLKLKCSTADKIRTMTDYWGSNTNKNIKSIAELLYAMLSRKKKLPGETFNSNEASTGKGAEGQLHGILGGAKRFLSLYQDPIVAANISHSDFKLEDLYDYDSPVSLYIVVSPSATQQSRLRPIVRLIIGLILDKVQESDKPKKHKVTFLIDEFPTLKKMGDIEDSFSTIAGYGVKFFIILQSLHHLEKYYGQHQTIYANALVRLIYSSADERTKKIVSSDSGNYTYVGPVVAQTKSGGIFGHRSTTRTMQESEKPLVTPDQVEKLPSDKMFIFIRGKNAIKCYKANYRKDKILLSKTQTIAYKSDILTLSPKVHVIEKVQHNSQLPLASTNINKLESFTQFAKNYINNGAYEVSAKT